MTDPREKTEQPDSAGTRIVEGAKEALGIVKGEQPAAVIWVNGFEYVPKTEFVKLKEALKSVLWGHDNAMTDILFGDMPDERPMAFTIPLGKYRKARRVLKGGEHG